MVEGYGRNAKNVYSQWVFPPLKQTKFTKKATFIVTLKQAIDPIAFTVAYIMHACALRNQQEDSMIITAIDIHTPVHHVFGTKTWY